MEYAYFVDKSSIGLDHTDLFIEIQKDRIMDDNIFSDMDSTHKLLKVLLAKLREDDVLYVQTVAELADDADGVREVLDYLQNRKVLLISCEENFLIGGEYSNIFGECLELMKKFSKRVKNENYQQALKAGRVGRPKKKDDKEIDTMLKQGMSVSQICRALKMSKSTYYRLKNGG